jgi:hypothetical protein
LNRLDGEIDSIDGCGYSGQRSGRLKHGDGRTTVTDRSAGPLEAPATRGTFLRGGAAAGLGLALGGTALLARPEAARSAPSQALDQRIFNFALLLEYLQAGFYSEAVNRGGLRGPVREFAEVVAGHERDHVRFLREALGPKARARPRFAFGDATRKEQKFVRAALLLENIGVGAYNGQAAKLTKPSLAAAAQIVSVEGRHAAWISDLTGRPPAPRAADPGLTAAEVTAALRSTGFIKTR